MLFCKEEKLLKLYLIKRSTYLSTNIDPFAIISFQRKVLKDLKVEKSFS